MSYNVLLTTPKANARVKPTVLVVTAKLALTYTNCGKIDHSMETCHNRKRGTNCANRYNEVYGTYSES
jgi:hypothetical protein